MKRLNGTPVVEVRLVVTFAVPFEEAERMIALGTDELKRIALHQFILTVPPDKTNITNTYSDDWKEFYTAYGKVLADKRATELRMLAAPAPVPHEADADNL